MASFSSSHLFPATTISAAVLMLLLLTTPTYADDLMYGGDTLQAGQSLIYGNYRFIMQKDCNLVLYDGGRAIWSSGTAGRGSICHTTLEMNGELAIYDVGKKIWSNNSGKQTGTYLLVLQRDRNVVIYGSGAAIWATNTVAKK